jgi:hypothetical protein
VRTCGLTCRLFDHLRCALCVFRSIKTLNDGFVETAAGTADTGSWESTGIIDCADVFDAR